MRSSTQETNLEGEDLEERIRRRIAAADEDGREKIDPVIGREIADRFQIYAKIGAGGMGAVYRAKQRGMDRDVAIKVLLRELAENETVVRRFHIEALAVSKLRHPNTIQIFDFGETPDGLLYIAMEFLEGKPLQKTLREQKQLSVQRGLKVALQIAKSLREAHGKGIIHRDLKPDN
ncbi:MAG: serine/threonine protein kinase, partial [Myxococcales bacterium]|nr:serine/threonine protein kinase [Myxococcales bacterium]